MSSVKLGCIVIISICVGVNFGGVIYTDNKIPSSIGTAVCSFILALNLFI